MADEHTVLMRRYLLGDVSDGDAERIEGEYFASDEVFGELLDAEDDLIDGFLDNRLSPRDRQLFEGRFFTTERGRGKVALAAALERATVRTARVDGRGRWLTRLAVAAAVASIVVSAGLLREITVMRRHIDHLEAPRVSQPNRVATSIGPATPEGAVFSIILSSGERGSASASTLTLPAKAGTAEFWLLLPRDDDPAYAASVQTVEGRTLWTEHGLRSRAVDDRRAIVVRIPGATLSAGTYIVSAMGEKMSGGLEPVEDFSFTIRRP
jgi:hypothetical protein